MIWVDLIYNLALLVALSVVSGFVDMRWGRNTRLGVLFQGLVFGGAALIGMLRPFVFAPGLIFDGRSVMISLGALFFGPGAAAVACVMTIPPRVVQGGPGAVMGVLVILISALIGAGFHRHRQRGSIEEPASRLLWFGVLVHLGMLAMTLALPSHLILPVLKRIALPVMLAYPLATVLIGKILSDQAARAQSLLALRESETRYRFLFEQNPMPMLIYERATLQMLAVNEAFLRHYGYTREEAVALRLTDLYPEEQKAKIAELIPRLRGHANVGEWRHRKRDGAFITIVVSSHDLIYEGKSARVAVTSDITERKRVEEELRATQAGLERRVLLRTSELAEARDRAEAADRLKSAFLATMSHELRTPLNSIIGFTGILLQGLTGPLNQEQAKQLGMVQNSARHLLALINDVLDISKIEAGQIEIHSDPFDLKAAVERIVESIRPVAEKKGLALRVQLPEVVPPVASDRRRVEQVLLNLLNNAGKFTERGEVTLAAETIPDFQPRQARAPQPAIRLRVADTGLGIKSEDLAKLFQPFRQIDSGLTRQHEGTGLGLAICRRLAELLGGEISVESAWGLGSTFTFIFPVNYSLKP